MYTAYEQERKSYHALQIHLLSDYRKLSRLYKTHHSWNTAWEHLATTETIIDREKAYAKLAKTDVRLILREEECFPAMLREIPHPPFGLYYLGVWPGSIIPQTTLAIVGTRKVSDDGIAIANDMAHDLAQAGIIIVSGLALGVDRAAHEGAMSTKGTTWAVLANGLPDIYPSNHKMLAKHIIDSGGALLSEYPPESPTLPYRFLERNRIVSGLSKGTIVIEAPARSGSLATARFALEQNREVFVVPGLATSYNYEGSHALLRQGARIVTKASDVLEDLNLVTPAITGDLFTNEEEKCMIGFLAERKKGVTSDELIVLSGLDPQTVNRTLSFLIIRNIIEEHGDRYKLKI